MKSMSDFSGHLTDEQICDLQAGDSSDLTAQAHLATCAVCREELASLESALESFNDASLAWAAAAAPRLVPPPSRIARSLGARPAWGLGFAGAAIVCLIAFGPHLSDRHRIAPTASQSASSALSNAELAQDNRLMTSIDQELNYQVQPAVPASELRPPSHHGHRLSPEPVSN